MMIPGKLYSCTDYCLLFYPTEETVASAARWSIQLPATAIAEATTADWWSRKLNCKVHYSEPGEVFMPLNTEDRVCLKILGANIQGWIVAKDWLEIERIK